jgi:hypothetical protein
METTKTKNGLSLKHNILGLGIIAAVFGGILLISQAGAQSTFEPQAPGVQATLDNFEVKVTHDRCELIKKLATAKLEDDMHSPVAGIDRNDLAAKRDMSCDF